MHLSIDSPRNGWLPITLEIAGTAFQFLASRLTNDVVADLIDICKWLALECVESERAEGTDRRTIHFWQEPLWNSLALDRMAGNQLIAVSYFSEHESASALNATSDDLLLLQPHRCQQCHRIELLETLSQAVEVLLRSASVYDYNSNWGHPLKLEQFSALLQARKSLNT